MSHGPSGDGAVKAEPNLIPLLDIVFQLLMFFMMCVNFVSEQVNQNIKLPVAQSARPMDKSQDAVLFLNINRSGQLEVPGQDPMQSMGDIKYYLSQQYADAERADKLKGGSGAVTTAIVIRADEASNYGQVFQVLQVCKQVGYRKLQLRATTKSS